MPTLPLLLNTELFLQFLQCLGTTHLQFFLIVHQALLDPAATRFHFRAESLDVGLTILAERCQFLVGLRGLLGEGRQGSHLTGPEVEKLMVQG